MPAFDQCHDQVVRALEKDGWTVINSPYSIFAPHRAAHADLRLSRGTNGRQEYMIVVEIKCFPDDRTLTTDLYTAIGQYLIYRQMLIALQLDYPVYLAIPEHIYERIFDEVVIGLVKSISIKIVVVNLDTETVTQWKE